MNEPELVERLAHNEFDRYENGSWDSACAEVKETYRIHVEAGLPIIRDYVKAQVAAAYRMCARAGIEALSELEAVGMSEEQRRVGDAIRSLTPDDTAKELERRDQMMTCSGRVEEHKLILAHAAAGTFETMKDFFEWQSERIDQLTGLNAELSKQPVKEPRQ